MAFDYTNFLETAVQANNADFLFYDRAGAVGAQATGDPAAESATLQYKETGDAASEWRDVP
jgi:hypothetical protein